MSPLRALRDRIGPGLVVAAASLLLPVAWILGAASPASPGSGATTVGQDAAGMAAALGLELEDLVRADPPSSRRAKSILEVADATAAQLGGTELFRATLPRPDGALSVRIARVPLGSGVEGRAALIALDDERNWLACAVEDAAGQAVGGWTHFLAGFEFSEVPRLGGARSRAWLAERRRSLEEGDDPDARLGLSLLLLLERMNEQASAYNLPRENRPLAPEQEFSMMAGAYREVAGLAEGLAPLLGEKADEFVGLARQSATAIEGMRAAMQTGDQAGARHHRRIVMQNCKSCHGMTGHPGEGELKEASLILRRSLAIGDGFYQIGHDVRIRHPDRREAQELADALRLGALALDALP